MAFVQGVTGNAASSPTTSTAFGSSVTVGNFIVVTISDDSGITASAVTGVTDSKGNTYTKILSLDSVTTLSAWYAKVTTGGTGLTVSVAWNTGSAARCAFAAQEHNGLTNATVDIT